MNERIPVGKTSLSLLERAKNNDQDAWEEIFRIYGPMILYWGHRYYKLSPQACEDVAQEVLSQLFRSLPEYEAKSFRGFLRSITHSKAIDFIRRNERHQAKAAGGTTALRNVSMISDPFVDEEDAEVWTPSEKMLLMRSAFEQAKLRFDAETIDIVKRVWLDGQRVKDVAEQLKLTEDAVSGRLKRVKKDLTERLDGILDL